MKIMIVFCMALSYLAHSTNADYRYRRMPQAPPRQHIQPQYLKKWKTPHQQQQLHQQQLQQQQLHQQQLQQQQVQQQKQLQQLQRQPQIPQRTRPVQMYLGVTFKKPVGPPVQSRPIALPLRVPQKSQQISWPSSYVQENKPLLTAPSQQISEYDYHVHNNQIPTTFIKQVDEKGPIHTIPAPNLSPADKPAYLEEFNKPRQNTVVEIQKAQQYQVTESPEPTKTIQYTTTSPTENTPTPVSEELTLTDQELYKFLQSIPVAPQENYAVFPAFQANPVLFQTEQAYVPKDIQPEYHSFNYQEPPITEIQIPNEYVQAYYENNVEGDIANQNVPDLTAGTYYSSLPNKQAADALASLQEAGKQHADFQKDVDQKTPMTIYVPDDDNDADEEMVQEAQQNQNESFGNRIRPKKQ